MAFDFEALLKEKMGLDAVSIGSAAVERAVQRRLVVTGLDDREIYFKRVTTTPAELQELIETVVVPETWFFRDREAFIALARLVREDWMPTHPGQTFRILSVPCSTGEEPYSMTMALLDAGMPAERFRVDAVDISRGNVAAGQQGVYGKNSFRGRDLDFRERHFKPVGSGWKIADSVRQQVDFRSANLLDDSFAADGQIYDVVFCRNLLIYFDRPTQDRAVTAINRILRPDGWFFVGPSETGLLLSHPYVSAKIPLAFAFRPTSAKPVAPAVNWTPPIRAARPRPVPPPPRAAPVKRPFTSPKTAPTPVAAPAETASDNIALALQLANRGQLAEAMKRCEAALRDHGPTAKTYYVMGLVRDAEGQSREASELYRKVLYLDPQHQEAMTHLGFLLEAQGRLADARIILERAQRLNQRQGVSA